MTICTDIKKYLKYGWKREGHAGVSYHKLKLHPPSKAIILTLQLRHVKRGPYLTAEIYFDQSHVLKF